MKPERWWWKRKRGKRGRRGRVRGRAAPRGLSRRAGDLPLTSSTSTTTTILPAYTTMSDNFPVEATPEAHAADIEYFVRRGMTKGYQLLSLLTPPMYTVFAFTRYGRSHINVNRLLRATWLGGSVGM